VGECPLLGGGVKRTSKFKSVTSAFDCHPNRTLARVQNRRLEHRARSSRGKCRPKHGQAANGRFLRRLVLDDVPVLGKLAVLEAYDIHHNLRRQAHAREPAVEEHVVAIGDGKPVLVVEAVGCDQMCFIEQGPPYRVRQDQGPRLARSKPEGLTGLPIPVILSWSTDIMYKHG
jgi:hypothetical protein